MKDFYPQPDSLTMRTSSQVEIIEDDDLLNGWRRKYSPDSHQSRIIIFKIICGCSGSGDMKVMQFKVETGQKVLDLKVILFLYSKQIFLLFRVTTVMLVRCLSTRARRQSLSPAVLIRPPGSGT